MAHQDKWLHGYVWFTHVPVTDSDPRGNNVGICVSHLFATFFRKIHWSRWKDIQFSFFLLPCYSLSRDSLSATCRTSLLMVTEPMLVQQASLLTLIISLDEKIWSQHPSERWIFEVNKSLLYVFNVIFITMELLHEAILVPYKNVKKHKPLINHMLFWGLRFWGNGKLQEILWLPDSSMSSC